MINLLIGLAVSLAVYFGLATQTTTLPSVLGALAAGTLVYVLLARRSNKQLQALMARVEERLGAQDFDAALELLEEGRSLARWQLLVNKIIDGQVGTILYAYKTNIEEARPYLERTLAQNWHAKAMLAASHFKVRDYDAMQKVFEAAVKANKKQGLLWGAYAWCEAKRGQRAEAIGILERGLKETEGDERLKRNLIALQNKKRMNMKDFTPEWWVLHLEKPPGQTMMPGGRVPGGGRVRSKRMRVR